MYLAKSSTDAALEAMHTRMYALLRWRTYRIPLSEFLEHLASDNGADMHKHYTLYAHRFIGMFWHQNYTTSVCHALSFAINAPSSPHCQTYISTR